MKKLISILVALAMMATLCVSMAFAVGGNEDVSENSDYNSADATLVKYLKIPAGYTLPDETFTFTFTPTDASEDGATATPITIAVSEMTESGNTSDGGALIKAKALKDAFTFTKPGFYEFTVAETAGDNTKMDYDNNTYTVRLYVSRVVTEEGTSYQIDNITIVNKEGTKEKTEVNDPTIVNGEDKTINKGDVGNGLTFTNTYTPDPRAEGANALEVSKAVAGDYADNTFAYPFTLTVTNAAFTGDKTIPVTKGDGSADTLELGEAYTFNLVPGQKLIIPNLPEGTTYTVTELLEGSGVDRTDSYQATAATTGIAATVGTAQKGKNLNVASAEGAVIEDDQTVANAVNYTNTADDLTPTGILISNLPYIALALVAIGGLVAYVVVRRRQDDEA